MKLREFNFEENEKYASIYRKALNKTCPEHDEPKDCCDLTMDSDGNYVPATPIGYDEEQLKWDALHDVLDTAFVSDKDYVCWSNGGYSRKDQTNPFETKEGETLKKYDPVLLLDYFGFPKGFVMFVGDYEVINEYGGLHVKPHFVYLYDGEELKDFRPKVYVGLSDEEENEKWEKPKKVKEMFDNPCV